MIPEPPSYARYEELGGSLGVEAYCASLTTAVSAVRETMWPNEPADEVQRGAYERAVCAAVDVDAAYGASGGIGEALSSVTLGGYSAHYAASGGDGRTAYDADMARAIRRELAGSGLLYRGLA